MLNKIPFFILSILLLAFLVGWIGGWKQSIKAGNEAYRTQDFDAAVNAFESAVSDKPDNPITHHNLGTALYKEGNFRRAAAAFQTSLLKGDLPNQSDVYYNLGNAQFQMRDLTGAIESYENSLRLKPYDVDAKHNLALAQQLLKEQQEKNKQQQTDSGEKKESTQNEPSNLSKAETDQLLEILTKNENQRRTRILKQQLNSGYRRDKDW